MRKAYCKESFILKKKKDDLKLSLATAYLNLILRFANSGCILKVEHEFQASFFS